MKWFNNQQNKIQIGKSETTDINLLIYGLIFWINSCDDDRNALQISSINILRKSIVKNKDLVRLIIICNKNLATVFHFISIHILDTKAKNLDTNAKQKINIVLVCVIQFNGLDH